MINNYLIDIKKIGIGTSSYGSKIPYKDSFKIIECLLDHGLNYIDTSPFYGLGQSEKIIGEIIKNKRDSTILSTKFGITPVINKSANKLIPIIKNIYYIPGIKSVVNNYLRSRNNRIQTLENISISIYQSLTNLRTTYLNNLFIHNNINQYIENKEILDFLFELKEKNIVNNLGITTDDYKLNNLELDNFTTLQVPHSKIDNFKNTKFKYNYYSIFSQGEINKSILIENILKHNSHFIIFFSNYNTINKNLNYFKNL